MGKGGPLAQKRREIGMMGEALAARFLKKRGYKILRRNFRCRVGEIDIVALEKRDTVFIEVRTSTSRNYSSPAESILWRKRRKLITLANFYIKKFGLEDTPCRFDVVSIVKTDGYTRIRLIKDAFWEV